MDVKAVLQGESQVLCSEHRIRIISVGRGPQDR